MERQKGLWHAILLAQLLALALAVTGISSQSLASKGIDAPTFQSFLNYVLLAVTFGAARATRWRTPLQQQWWRYALLAVLDVEGNYLVTRAYQYTSITSVTLLDCFTIPVVMLLSTLLLNSRYRLGHLGGAALCIAGLSVLVVTDRSSSTGGSAPLLGDALVLLGACCYAACNVTQELLLGDSSVMELLAMQGSFGALFAGLQVLLFERSAVAQVKWQASGALLPFMGFAAALYLFYSLVPVVLIWGGATVLNLSLLSSDLWAGLARLLLFGGFGGTGPFFLLALVLVSGGISTFALSGATKDAGHASAQQRERPRGYLRLDSRASTVELAFPEVDGLGSDDSKGDVVSPVLSPTAAAASRAPSASPASAHKQGTLEDAELGLSAAAANGRGVSTDGKSL